MRAGWLNAAALVGRWVIQSKLKQPEVFRQFNDWLIQQVEATGRSISAFQDDLIARYHEKLDEAHAAAKAGVEGDQEFWGGVLADANAFAERLNDLRKLSDLEEASR